MTRRLRPLVATFAIALVMAASACKTDAGNATEAPGPPSQSSQPTTDPYEIYLANNPDPSFVLSREDAQARAYLGCGTNFAPGTIDAVLADAYRPLGICD